VLGELNITALGFQGLCTQIPIPHLWAIRQDFLNEHYTRRASSLTGTGFYAPAHFGEALAVNIGEPLS
jgi:hypothetical protein